MTEKNQIHHPSFSLHHSSFTIHHSSLGYLHRRQGACQLLLIPKKLIQLALQGGAAQILGYNITFRIEE